MKLSDVSKANFFPDDPETARLLLDLWVLVNDREFPFRIRYHDGRSEVGQESTGQITIREAKWVNRLHRLGTSLELIDIFLLALVCADRKRWSAADKASREDSDDQGLNDYEGLEDVLALIAYKPWVSGDHHWKYMEALRDDPNLRFSCSQYYFFSLGEAEVEIWGHGLLDTMKTGPILSFACQDIFHRKTIRIGTWMKLLAFAPFQLLSNWLLGQNSTT
jgi:hypothetical protein